MLWGFRLFGLSACRSLDVGSLDGIDGDEWYCEQLTGTRDILGAGLAGEQTVVADDAGEDSLASTFFAHLLMLHFIILQRHVSCSLRNSLLIVSHDANLGVIARP